MLWLFLIGSGVEELAAVVGAMGIGGIADV